MFNLIKKTARVVPLCLIIPFAVCAQSPVSNADSNLPLNTVELNAIDSEKLVKINTLLETIDAKKLIEAIGSSAQMQAHQFVPAILSDALSESKLLTDRQKQAAVPGLQKNAIPKLVQNAGKVFFSESFKQDALNAQKNAYAKYYSLKEIKDLTTFYRSSTGKKFIQVQDQVGRDIVNSLLQKYMPLSIRETRMQADREIVAIKPVVKSVNKSAKAKK